MVVRLIDSVAGAEGSVVKEETEIFALLVFRRPEFDSLRRRFFLLIEISTA